MNIIEKQAGDQSRLYVPPEQFPTHIARLITARLGIDPDAVASRLQVFFDRCSELLRAYKFDEMPALASELDLDLRRVEVARPDEGAQIAIGELTHVRGRLAGWLSEEIDAARAKAHPSAIISFNWHRARTADGRALSRASVREGMRSAAYDDARWQKYLATLPKIEAPQEDPR